MKPTGRELIDVLEKAAVLEWFRYPRSSLDEGSVTPPVVVWRFDSTKTSVEQIQHVIATIQSVLAAFVGNVAWSLKNTGRNWVLLPTRVRELEESGQFRTDGEVLDYLRQEDPFFGKEAHHDLVEIAGAVANRL
ncbi:hypothetical protein [Alkalilimnicola ehrlichii]|uniref:hypothetical protein n=1 Tax=Alkalilimnicola ehrlichii TaxID=351052 RepID=UPI0011C02FF5|nr:hypothetical protein [Alkalilimnicola ehrlichii]